MAYSVTLFSGTEQSRYMHITPSASSSILFGGHGRPRTAKSKGSSIHYIQLYSYHVCKAIVAISIETGSGQPGHIFSGSSGSDLDWIT